MNRPSVALLSLILIVVEVSRAGKILRRYGIKFSDEDGVEQFISRAGFAEFMKFRGHIIMSVLLSQICTIAALMGW